MRRAYTKHTLPQQRSAEEIAALADRVEAGMTVDADLTDGTFVAVMGVLKRRGWGVAQRSEVERYMKPFLIKVERTHDNKR